MICDVKIYEGNKYILDGHRTFLQMCFSTLKTVPFDSIIVCEAQERDIKAVMDVSING